MDYHAWLTKERNDGTVYSVVTFVVFLVASLSTSFITILLDFVGFNPVAQVNQAAGVANNIKNMSALLPVIRCVLIFVCFFFIYNMNDQEMARVSAEVNVQDKEKEEDVKEDELDTRY